jgi:uncharacterized delta-60 repeat protein
MGNIILNGITPAAGKIKLGTQSIGRIYAGNTLVWGGSFNENLGDGTFSSLGSTKVLTDGSVITYTRISGAGIYYSNSTAYLYVAKYSSSGVLDTSFAANTLDWPIEFDFIPSSANSLVIHPDGESALICGRCSGSDQGYKILKVNNDGALDMTFNNNAKFLSQYDAGRGYCVATSGQDIFLYVSAGGLGLVKLSQEGVQDTSFPSIEAQGGAVNTITPLDDGGFLLAGPFTSINNTPNTRHLGKINADGTVDTTFASNWGNPIVYQSGGNAVESVVIAPDGSMFVGGIFEDVDVILPDSTTIRRDFIIKLNSNGTINSDFSVNMGLLRTADPNFGGVNQIKIITDPVGGNYKVLLAGDFYSIQNPITVSPDCLTRLTSEGVVDMSFYFNQSTQSVAQDSIGFDDAVNGVDIQDDGKIIAVGSFGKLHGVDRPKIARLTSDGYAD